MYIIIDSWIFIFLGYNPIWLYFVYQIVLALAVGRSSIWHLCPLTYVHKWCVCVLVGGAVLEHTLLSGTIRCSGLILYISYPSPRISHFSKEPWFFLLENVFKNQELNTWSACCYWDVVTSRPSHLTEQKNMCLYNTYITQF